MSVAIFLLILLIIILGIMIFSYHMTFYTAKRTSEHCYTLPPGMTEENMAPGIRKSMDYVNDLPFEAVTIRAHDGKTLYAKYYHLAEEAPLQILFHGYRSCPQVDCSGGTYLARMLGHNVLLVDQRSHGHSEGHCITFGVLERLDCLAWIHYANRRFGSHTPIVLGGLSMGAATVLMASDLDLPENLKGIFADCPFSSPKAIIQKTAAAMKFPAGLAWPFIRLSALLFGRFDPEAADAVRAVRKARVPILLIHGESDSFVPCDMSRSIYEACASPCTLELFPGADHGHSYLVDPQRYERVAKDFLERIL